MQSRADAEPANAGKARGRLGSSARSGPGRKLWMNVDVDGHAFLSPLPTRQMGCL